MADLTVEDGGASSLVVAGQNALAIVPVNNGPYQSPDARVAGLPTGAEVIHISQGHYDGTSGVWNIGELKLRGYHRSRGEPDPTLVLGAAAGDTANVSIASSKNYEVCIGGVDNPVDLAHTTKTACEADTAPGVSWHSTPVYDYNADNNTATITAARGTGTEVPVETAKPFVAVTWQGVGDVDGFSVSHYQVWRSACDDQEPVTMGPPRKVADDVAATVWVDLDVVAEQTYCYLVRAVNVLGAEGSFSRKMERKAREPLAPKVSPAGVPDQPVLSAAALPDQERERILLTWDKPNENGWPIISYTLEASDRNGGPWTPVKIEPVPGLKTYDYIYPPEGQERLTGGTRKYFRLQATNERGDSDWSSVVSATTHRAGLPEPPVNVLARPAAPPDDGSVIIAYWEPPDYDGGADITGYEIQWSPNGESGWRYAGRADADTFAFKNTGLGYGTTRYYRVAAHNSRGRGAWSDPPVAAVTAAKEEGASLPGAPTNLKLEAGSQWIRASWDAPASDGGSPIKGYRVQYREGRSGAWETLSAFPKDTSTGLTGIPNGVTFQVRVAAVNGAGTGPYTTPESATPYYPPGTPRNLSLTPGNGRLTAKWDPPEIPGNPNLNGYSVQYRASGVEQWTDWRHRGTRTETTITGLTNGTTYQVQVASLSAPLPQDRRDYTAAVSATPVAPSQ